VEAETVREVATSFAFPFPFPALLTIDGGMSLMIRLAIMEAYGYCIFEEVDVVVLRPTKLRAENRNAPEQDSRPI